MLEMFISVSVPFIFSIKLSNSSLILRVLRIFKLGKNKSHQSFTFLLLLLPCKFISNLSKFTKLRIVKGNQNVRKDLMVFTCLINGPSRVLKNESFFIFDLV